MADVDWDLPSVAKDYPPDYVTAREAFRELADASHCERREMWLNARGPDRARLCIDVAWVREAGQPTLVISSGLHGVEAPLGCAIQQQLLRCMADGWPNRPGVLLLHVLNPYGFAWRRRFNERNVDLNRNFLLANEIYAGAPAKAFAMRNILGPRGRPSRLSNPTLRLGYAAARHGISEMWQTLPVGQYEIDDWLFFGGRELSETGRLLAEHLPTILGDASDVVHFDFHTGLGRWSRCDLLLSEPAEHPEAEWWHQNFADQHVVESTSNARYVVRGGLGPWLQHLFPSCRYHFATAEVGTYSARRVLGALIEEARWNAVDPMMRDDHPARQRLQEAFIPRSHAWRRSAVTQGVALIERAARYLNAL